MAPHSSTLAWTIPWMEEPGGLQSMGSLRVRHDWATSLSLFTFMHWRRTWQPTPVFLPGESQGWQSLVGCHLWGQTQLKWLSSSSSSCIAGRFFTNWAIREVHRRGGEKKTQRLCLGKLVLSRSQSEKDEVAEENKEENKQVGEQSQENQIRSDQISRSVMSDSLRPHESQHARPPCPYSILKTKWREYIYFSL